MLGGWHSLSFEVVLCLKPLLGRIISLRRRPRRRRPLQPWRSSTRLCPIRDRSARRGRRTPKERTWTDVPEREVPAVRRWRREARHRRTQGDRPRCYGRCVRAIRSNMQYIDGYVRQLVLAGHSCTPSRHMVKRVSSVLSKSFM